MPWDAAALHLAALDAAGQPGRASGTSPATPGPRPSSRRSAPTGSCISCGSRDGHWNLFRASPDGGAPPAGRPRRGRAGAAALGARHVQLGVPGRAHRAGRGDPPGRSPACAGSTSPPARGRRSPCEVAAVSHLRTGPARAGGDCRQLRRPPRGRVAAGCGGPDAALRAAAGVAARSRSSADDISRAAADQLPHQRGRHGPRLLLPAAEPAGAARARTSGRRCCCWSTADRPPPPRPATARRCSSGPRAASRCST